MAKLVSRNPATGEVLQEFEPTPIDALPEIFARARGAQSQWAAHSLRKRASYLLQLKELLLDQADELAALIARENGKPPFEALTHEILPSIELLSHFARRAPRLLRDQRLALRPTSLHRSSYLNYWPLGVVAVISPWNFPFFLPFSEIVLAIVAGNAVIFKPSELSPLAATKIQELFGMAGLPADLLQVALGDGALGAALIEQEPAKIFFTGSVPTGKAVMAAAARHLIPVNLELGGKDAMIVLPDADLDYASSAALWGGFFNSGQACASIERLILHESIAEPFLARLKDKALRLGPRELGSITLELQKEIYLRQLEEARAHGARFVFGGNLSADQRRLEPTLVIGSTGGPGIEKLAIYNEETFGPVIAATTFRTLDEAVQKANQGHYGLHASIISRNHALAEELARRLEVGTVLINEVAFTAGSAEAPWGGVKQSGIGRTRADLGLYEFVHVRHIQKPRTYLAVRKSPWWFPYTESQYTLFRQALGLYRKSFVAKFQAISHTLWNLAQFLKTERRL